MNTRCPRCAAPVHPVSATVPAPLCIECDPTAAQLLERREKDRASAYLHSLRNPRTAKENR